MKIPIMLLLVFYSVSIKAQTYTTKQLSQYMRSQWKTNDSTRALKKQVDSMVFKVSTDDFIFDPVTHILYIRWKNDTLIVKRVRN